MKLIHIPFILIVVQFALTALCIEVGNEIDKATPETVYWQRLIVFIGYYRTAWVVCLFLLIVSIFFI